MIDSKKVIPLFKSEFSLNGRSILTIANQEKLDKHNSQLSNIPKLCADYEINPAFLVEDNMSGFYKTLNHFGEFNIDFFFGLRMTCCNNAIDLSPESLSSNHKIIIFIKNTQGYYDLIKLYNYASTQLFYYEPRVDFSILNQFWTENLLLCVPFFDSFIYNNILYDNHNSMPDFSNIQPTFFTESHHMLPITGLLTERVVSYCKKFNFQIQPAASIYYHRQEDFLAWQIFKCISNRSKFDAPNRDMESVDSFSLEYWLKNL